MRTITSNTGRLLSDGHVYRVVHTPGREPAFDVFVRSGDRWPYVGRAYPGGAAEDDVVTEVEALLHELELTAECAA